MNHLSFIKMLCIVFIPFCIHSQIKLNLEEAITVGLTNNFKIKQAEERVKQKDYQDIEANGNFFPQINIMGSYNHLNDPLAINLEPIRQLIINLQSGNQTEIANIYSLLQTQKPLPDPLAYKNNVSKILDSKIPKFEQILKKEDYYTASITAVQPLFTGGKLLAAKEYSSTELETSKHELIQIKNEITAEIINSYLNVLFLNEVVKTRMDVVEGVKKHKERAEKLFKEGLISNHNLLRAEVSLADAEKNLISDQSKLKLSMLALKNVLQIDLEEEITIENNFIFNPVDEDITLLVSTALEDQPVLKILENKKHSAEQKYNAERSTFLPTIAAFGKYELIPKYLSALEPEWIVGVQASINLFNGFKDYSKLQAAKHLEDEVDFIQKEVKNKIILLINKNYSEMLDALSKFDKSSSNIRLSKENLRLNEKRFDSGLGTSFDVIDANLLLEKNEIDKKQALFEYYKSVCSLYLTAGTPIKFLNIWDNKGE